MAVMIGTGPHKGSHTAVAVGAAEEPLGKLRVRACPDQAGKLVAWAQAWPERTWAVEGARGLGRLLARQLVAAGERVLDVQPKLAARVRLLEAGDTNKTDPDDARLVAVAALRSKGRQEVTVDGHAVVLKVRAKRHRDLSRTRNQVVCRLPAVLCELIPGGVPDEITAGQAARILEQVAPAGAVAQARCELAAELLADIRHLDAQRREVKKKLAAAVTASGTSLTEVFGVGPVIAATVIGDVITVARFPSRDHFAACNGTAPVEVSSGQRKIYRLSLRGNRRLNHAIYMAAINWIRHKHSDGRAYYQRKLAEGKTRKEALRCLKRRISDAIYARLRADARKAAPGGQPGNDTGSSVTGSHPGHRLFGQATSGPEPSLRAPATFTQATPAPEPSAKKIQRVLLHGPPGTGKTLSTMYLLHAMAGRTTILLTGRGLGLIEQALAIGRDLAPATFVFEDIDLVAAERTMEFGSQGVLFELLNQMEGLAEDQDLLFVLTTNRPDLIEPALAARPGRVDLALEIPLPDADGRRRLLGLYGAGIEIDAGSVDRLAERSDGVSGAFIKELVRQAWLRAALEDREPPTAQDLRRVLDDLLEERSTLTRRLLGQAGDDTDGHPFPAMRHALHAAGLPIPAAAETP